MIEQKPLEDTPKPPEKADEPPALGTGIKGDGKADGFGVGKSGNGGRIGGNGNGGSGGGRFDAYAAQARTTITNALRQNPKTRSATINRQILRYWQDSTGRITRAKLDSSTGDAALDAAIIEALVGLQGPPPPAGMPMPVVIRFSAQRR
jgi:TonB family protein